MGSTAAKRWGVVLDLPGAANVYHRVADWDWGELHPSIPTPIDDLGVSLGVAQAWIAAHQPAKTTTVIAAPPEGEGTGGREHPVDAVCPVKLVEMGAPKAAKPKAAKPKAAPAPETPPVTAAPESTDPPSEPAPPAEPGNVNPDPA